MHCHVPLRNRAGLTIASAIVDWKDYDRVMQYRWSFDGDREYAKGPNGILLSHFISGKPSKGFVVDHINWNKLDDTRANLRTVTLRQNGQNKRKRGGTTSRYLGVSWDKPSKEWKAACSRIYLGKFELERDAAAAYDKAALFLYGPGAHTNRIGTEATAPPMRNKRQKLTELELPKGVWLNANGQRYIAAICYGGSTHRLGTFDSMEAARDAYNDALIQHEAERLEEHMARAITRNQDGTAIISINRNCDKSSHVILVDDQDWHRLTMYSWSVQKKNYVRGYVEGRTISMHQYLLPSECTDHINNNRLDNRRSVNLRSSDASGNRQNCTLAPNRLYRGISKRSSTSWGATITKNNKIYYIGTYASPTSAAQAYDAMAMKLFAHPRLNFPILSGNAL